MIYIKPSQLETIKYTISGIPKLIHRTLLYDDEFPSNILCYLNHFHENYSDYTIVLWNNQDVIDILNPNEIEIYLNLKKIQKSDFARLVIIRKYGGIYADFDIEHKSSLSNLIDKIEQTQEGIVFIEHVHRLNKQCNYYKKFKIRNNIPENKIRIANYILIFKSNSLFINKCIDLCLQRIHLPITSDYDILYTTGPDILSTIFASYSNDNLLIISLQEGLEYFVHKCAGHWRKD